MIEDIKRACAKNFWLAAAVGVAAPACADDFLCDNVVTIRKIPGESQAGPLPSAKTLTLRLHLDEAEPDRSTMEWQGDANVDGAKSRWPGDVKLVRVNGTIAATVSATKDGLGSVVTLTVDPKGALRITESSLVPKGVIYDVTEARCTKLGN